MLSGHPVYKVLGERQPAGAAERGLAVKCQLDKPAEVLPLGPAFTELLVAEVHVPEGPIKRERVVEFLPVYRVSAGLERGLGGNDAFLFEKCLDLRGMCIPLP